MNDLPTCPHSGKISFLTKRLPDEYRARSRSKCGRRKTKWMLMYKCKACPYYHQTSET